MNIDVKALVPFFMGVFFSLLLAARYSSVLLRVAFSWSLPWYVCYSTGS